MRYLVTGGCGFIGTNLVKHIFIEDKDNYADISKAKNVLDFEPEVDLYDGLEKTFVWFKENLKRSCV